MLAPERMSSELGGCGASRWDNAGGQWDSRPEINLNTHQLRLGAVDLLLHPLVLLFGHRAIAFAKPYQATVPFVATHVCKGSPAGERHLPPGRPQLGVLPT